MTLLLQAQYCLDLTRIEVAEYFNWYSVSIRRCAEPNISHLMKYCIKCAEIYGQPIPDYARILAKES